MTSHKNPVLLRNLALLMSLVALALVTSVLLGWLAHIEVLVRSGPDRAAMVPSTAISLALLFCGLAVAASGRETSGRVLACAAGAAMVALTNTLVVSFGAEGLDALLAKRPMHDRMSPGTVTGLLIGAAGLAGLSLPSLRRAELPLLAALSGLTGITAVFMVHNFLPGTVMALSFFEGMSIYTALSLLGVFGGLLMLGLAPSSSATFTQLNRD
ncbi:hypothetical protein [Salipiger sp. PrR002]|uniref:hypothetical protein n=1 Tax=Salipiger sp. PrR002 TaxID=2706489 RepID=UPI0013BBE3CA|nr:hypothetical protein [Salipiger sp. PrR002]NDV97847.1 hypothetical protein [Salipiger sp. PrR002]NDW55338.1 hypothetical protein [Salipiger sp. PrR004]